MDILLPPPVPAVTQITQHVQEVILPWSKSMGINIEVDEQGVVSWRCGAVWRGVARCGGCLSVDPLQLAWRRGPCSVFMKVRADRCPPSTSTRRGTTPTRGARRCQFL